MKSIYIIILVFNQKKETISCLRELCKVKVQDYKLEIVLIDNNSSDGTEKDIVNKFPKVIYKRNKKNLGFSAGVNKGIQIAQKNKSCEYILLLNNDTYELSSNFITSLIKTAKNDPKIGITAPALKHYVGKKLFYGMEGQLNLNLAKATHRNTKTIRSKKIINADFVSGCCMLIKKEVFLKAGLFDEGYFLYLEDVDFCLKAKQAGFKVVLDPNIIISHKVSASLSNPLKKIPYSFKSNLRLISKWTPLKHKPLAFFHCLYFYPSLAVLWSGRILKRKITKTLNLSF